MGGVVLTDQCRLLEQLFGRRAGAKTTGHLLSREQH